MAANNAAGEIVRCDIELLIEFVHPDVESNRHAYRYSCTVNLNNDKWVIDVGDSHHRIIFDGSEVVETQAWEPVRQEPHAQLPANATVHLVRKGVPLTLDRRHFAVWFAYCARDALVANEGKPFPSMHGNYIYDIHSHCCVVNSEWPTEVAMSPSRVTFRYSADALNAARMSLSDEELVDNAEQRRALRENYLRLALPRAGEIAGEYAVTRWVQAGSTALPAEWVYNLALLGTPTLRISGRVLDAPTSITSEQFEPMLRYDARLFRRITDFRFLPVMGLDRISYTNVSSKIEPTNAPRFAALVDERLNTVALVHREHVEQRGPSMFRRVVGIALLVLVAVAPIVLWSLRRLRGSQT